MASLIPETLYIIQERWEMQTSMDTEKGVKGGSSVLSSCASPLSFYCSNCCWHSTLLPLAKISLIQAELSCITSNHAHHDFRVLESCLQLLTSLFTVVLIIFHTLHENKLDVEFFFGFVMSSGTADLAQQTKCFGFLCC